MVCEPCRVGAQPNQVGKSWEQASIAQKPINQAKPPWTRKSGTKPIWWQKPRAGTDRPPHGPAAAESRSPWTLSAFCHRGSGDDDDDDDDD
eukprot:365014-Chlamydomonas_euryale.AAC.16